MTPHGFGSLGFHLRRIAGNAQRMMTYVQGRQLSDPQMADIKMQHEPGASRKELLAAMRVLFDHAATAVRSFDPEKLTEPREVGRKCLPITVILAC